MALRESSVWWEWPACTPAAATQRAALMGDVLAAGVREDFPEEAAEEQGENIQWTCSPCIPVLGLF